MNKKILTFMILFVSSIASFARADAPGILGGEKLSRDHVHYVGAGWPSMFYEYWMSGKSLDWAVGGEFVYGDYVGYLSEVDVGVGINIPIKWHLSSFHKGDLALRVNPGFLIADANQAVFGIRAEVGLPVNIRVHPKVNLITGGNIPFTIMIPNHGSSTKYVPIFGRIGAEFNVAHNIVPSILLEMGPVIVAGGSKSDTGLGVRISASALLF